MRYFLFYANKENLENLREIILRRKHPKPWDKKYFAIMNIEKI
jgi:hypothetical protein